MGSRIAAAISRWVSGTITQQPSIEAPPPIVGAPAPGSFTFGDLFRHLAGLERFMWAENVQGRPSAYPGHGIELAAGLEGVRAYLDQCHTEATTIFGGLSNADLLAPCQNPSGAEMATSA